MRLLVADDSKSLRLMLRAVIDKSTFEIVQVTDGEQAWDVMSQSDAPRLALLDWEMPGLDGLEVCQRIRARESDDPPYLILLTGRDETSDIVAGLEAGANDYITKPFDDAELRARLQVGKRMLDLQQELNSAKKALIVQAYYDALTGVLNRGAVMKSLRQEIERAKRQSHSLHVALLDIDHFKQVNDTHGHLVGDAVLQQLAKRVEAALRPYDRIGRYGGEEFLVVVACEDSYLTALFERLRSTVADQPFIHQDTELRVTISCGVATFMPSGDECDASELLAVADKALYQAKASGRNRTVLASDQE